MLYFPDMGRLERREGVAGGAVCYAGTGVNVEFVVGRFIAGESLDDLATDYALSRQTIEAGVRLVLLVNGVSLDSKRAEAKLWRHVPLLTKHHAHG